MKDRDSLLSIVGNTPLVRLKASDEARRGQVWAKLEFMNPGGSVKDRICLAMVESMESAGIIQPGDTLVEASGGNTAVSLAMVAAAKGYGLILVMPETVPVETRRHLAAYDAEIITTSSGSGMRGALDRAVEAAESGTRRVLVDQFGNPVNPETHRRTTAVEIIRERHRPRR